MGLGSGDSRIGAIDWLGYEGTEIFFALRPKIFA